MNVLAILKVIESYNEKSDIFFFLKIVRTADYDTIDTVYLSLCTQSAVNTLFERQAVGKAY